MELVKISAYAEGYYSNATYYEEVFLTKESYDKISGSNFGFSVYELDGKHSEVDADITVKELDEEDIKNIEFKNDDGEKLYETLYDIFEDNDLDFEEEWKKVNDYLSKIDIFIKMTVKVRKSQKELVEEFIKNLREK